jgi:hypothetical protein
VRRCLSRDPGPDEIAELQKFLASQQVRFGREGADVWSLLTDDEQKKDEIAAKLPNGTSARDLAAWTALARVVLSLDETITKE